MKKFYLSLTITCFLMSCTSFRQPIDYVNVFIGTGQHGNTYPGAQAPFGMISISPNTVFEDYDADQARPGYKYSATEIYGFGLTHFSGVGCHAMQDVQFLPIAGSIDVSPVKRKGTYKSSFSHSDETASPGYYSVKLKDYDITTEFTLTQRAGYGIIHYNKANRAYLVFQPTNSANGIADGYIQIDFEKQQVTGMVKTGGFCWRDPNHLPYTLYFVFRFDKKFEEWGIWKGNEKFENQNNIWGEDIAAYISFCPMSKVEMKCAISYVSIDNAIQNLETELQGDFKAVLNNTKKQWNKYLSKIQVRGGNVNEKTAFYTALYHNLLVPNIFNDVNGLYIGFDDKIHKIEKGRNKYVNFSLWDTYRTTSYLQAMIAPAEAADMVHSLYLDALQGGSFPNWSMNNVEYGVMNGYSSFPFIANIVAMGVTDFDLVGIKNLMKKVSTQYTTCKGVWGWHHVDEYMRLGYVPVDIHGLGASMTIEYAIDDYSIAKICQAAGDTLAATYYFNRSQNVFNLFNPQNKLLQPKNSKGEFIEPFDKTSQTGFCEGNAMQYFWSIPHSISKLISLSGGNKFIEERLDTFMSKILLGWAPDKPYYWVGNEPCFGVPYIYNFIQKPHKAQYHVREIMNRCFNATPDGLPGDDDAGAMSALYVFMAMGIYPYLPGTGGFTITTPLFRKINITTASGQNIVIKTKGAATNAPYIHSMKINGKTNTRTWIDWSKIKNGAIIEFTVDSLPKPTWGSSNEDIPPSYMPQIP